MVTLVTTVLPSETLWVSWVRLIQAVTGAKTVAEYPSQLEAFTVILGLNSLAVLAVALMGAILMSPFVLPIYGAFYGLAISRSGIGVPDPFRSVLICLEALFLVLTATFSSSFGSAFFGFFSLRPRALLRFWMESLRRTPEPSVGCRAMIKREHRVIILAILTIISLQVFSAWFEVWVIP